MVLAELVPDPATVERILLIVDADRFGVYNVRGSFCIPRYGIHGWNLIKVVFRAR